MARTIVASAVITGSGNHHRHRSGGARLTLDVRLDGSETIHRRVPTDLTADQAVFQGFTGRPRRLAFDLAGDGTVLVRLPRGREDSRASSRKPTADEIEALLEAFGRIPPDPFIAAITRRNAVLAAEREAHIAAIRERVAVRTGA
jgi:hypothetical protein